MQYIAEGKNIKVAPRKVRLVSDAVKRHKGEIGSVLSALSLSGKRASLPLKKLIDSAVANAVNNANAKKDNLMLKNIIVNEGVAYKRYHFAGRGRTRPYKKRTSHIKVILEDRIENKIEKINEKKENEKVGKEGSNKQVAK